MKWKLLALLILTLNCSIIHAKEKDKHLTKKMPESSGSLRSLNKTQAFNEQRKCIKYMAKRKWKMVYPSPNDWCRAVRIMIERGQNPGDWRI